MINDQYAFLDVETTGLNCHLDEVIEIAIILSSKGSTGERFTSLVKPQGSVPRQVSFLTGITDEMLKDAPPAAELRGKVKALLEKKVIVAHNAPFDLGFVQAMLGEPLTNKWIDTIDLAKILFPNLSSYSLRYLIRHFNLETCPNHRAFADTEALEKLFVYLKEQAWALSLQEVHSIYYFLQDEEKGLAHFFAEILKAKIKNYDFAAPLPLRSKAQPKENGGRKARKPEVSWSPEELLAMFRPGGAIAQGFASYQERPAQLQMLRAVAKAFTQQRYLLVEAGPGEGKSLAFLVPALARAAPRPEKVAGAAHTLALQRQRRRGGIPFFEQTLPFFFLATCLTGSRDTLYPR